MSKDEELLEKEEGEVDETEWEFVEQENEQQACLQPLTTESSKANSEGDMIHYYCVIYSSLFLIIIIQESLYRNRNP